jgi:hypothetical protein
MSGSMDIHTMKNEDLMVFKMLTDTRNQVQRSLGKSLWVRLSTRIHSIFIIEVIA